MPEVKLWIPKATSMAQRNSSTKIRWTLDLKRRYLGLDRRDSNSGDPVLG